MYLKTDRHAHQLKPQAGFSLLELSASFIILGIMILIMIPSFSSTDPKKLELAAEIVAQALRYARSESMRTGQIHGVLIDTNGSQALGKDITVFKADLSQSPFGNLETLYHPVSKKPYDLWLNQSPATRGVEFKNSGNIFSFEGQASQKRYLFFNAQGLPVYVENGTLFAFTGGKVRLMSDELILRVSIDPATGRVTVN